MDKLKDIVANSTDLFSINIDKKDRKDRNTWVFTVNDSRWKNGDISGLTFKEVTLRRGNCFFHAYRNERFKCYFVDTKKAIFRNSIKKYLSSMMQYYVYSNDISVIKNASSFKVSELDMKKHGIDNFLELCHEYKDYTAIGTGYTRNLRNLLVMDIDVDVTRYDNKQALNGLLLLFAEHDSLPDFYIFNSESRHVQLQWLIQNLNYKEIDWTVVDRVRHELESDEQKDREIPYKKIDFTKISDEGMKYRKFTLAMCDIVKNKRKFGDKNFTFWKAKNPMSALYGISGLELKIPYFKDGEIMFLEQGEMIDLFSTKECRDRYFSNAPSIDAIYRKLDEIMSPLMMAISDSKVKDIVDGEETDDCKKNGKKEKAEAEGCENSRNSYVLETGRKNTWRIARKMGCRNASEINEELMSRLYSESLSETKKMYRDRDRKYGGNWPGTSNHSYYSDIEFDKTFKSAFDFAVSNFTNSLYSDEDREKSRVSRGTRRSINILEVLRVSDEYPNLSRSEKLEIVNERLSKPISMGSFKRYYAIVKDMNTDDIMKLTKECEEERGRRLKSMNDAIESGKDNKTISKLKRKVDYLS